MVRSTILDDGLLALVSTREPNGFVSRSPRLSEGKAVHPTMAVGRRTVMQTVAQRCYAGFGLQVLRNGASRLVLLGPGSHTGGLAPFRDDFEGFLTTTALTVLPPPVGDSKRMLSRNRYAQQSQMDLFFR